MKKNRYEDVFGPVYHANRNDIKMLQGYADYIDMTNVNKILIHSDSDNSIPYALFDIIEQIFEAHRVHLG